MCEIAQIFKFSDFFIFLDTYFNTNYAIFLAIASRLRTLKSGKDPADMVALPSHRVQRDVPEQIQTAS